MDQTAIIQQLEQQLEVPVWSGVPVTLAVSAPFTLVSVGSGCPAPTNDQVWQGRLAQQEAAAAAAADEKAGTESRARSDQQEAAAMGRIQQELGELTAKVQHLQEERDAAEEQKKQALMRFESANSEIARLGQDETDILVSQQRCCNC
jgi:hypothetical protein